MDAPRELRLELSIKDQYGPYNNAWIQLYKPASGLGTTVDDHYIPPEDIPITNTTIGGPHTYRETWTKRTTGGLRPIIKAVAVHTGDWTHSPDTVTKVFGGQYGPYAKDVIAGEDGTFYFTLNEGPGFRSLDPSTKSISELSWYHSGRANQAMALAASNFHLFSVTRKNELYRRYPSRTDMDWKKIDTIDFEIAAMTANNRRLFAISKDDFLWSCLPIRNHLDLAGLNELELAESYMAVNTKNDASENKTDSSTAVTATNNAFKTIAKFKETWTKIGKVKVGSTLDILESISNRIIHVMGKDDILSTVVANTIVNRSITHEDILAVAMSDEEPFVHLAPTNNIIALAASNGNLFAVTRRNELWVRPATTEDLPWLPIGHANHVTSLGATHGNLFGVNGLGELWMRSADVTSGIWLKAPLTNTIKPITITGINTGPRSGVLYAVTKKDDALWVLDTPGLIT
jgi:hypothetical protein